MVEPDDIYPPGDDIDISPEDNSWFNLVSTSFKLLEPLAPSDDSFQQAGSEDDYDDFTGTYEPMDYINVRIFFPSSHN